MPSSRQALQRLLALLAVEQRILVLHRRDRMHLVRAADGLRIGFRQAERAHLALLDQALHRADRVLDRRVRVDAVLVVEVDDVDAQALEARLAGLHHVVRACRRRPACRRRSFTWPNLVATIALRAPAALERLAEQRLVVAPAVHVGRVEEVDALVERVVDHADRLVVVGVAVDARHRHQAQAEGRDLEAALAQLTLLHPILLRTSRSIPGAPSRSLRD